MRSNSPVEFALTLGGFAGTTGTADCICRTRLVREIDTGATSMNLKVVEEIQIDAKPEQIYQAWTDEHLLTAWWGNAEFRTTRWQGELRAGGHWRVEFADAKGNIYSSYWPIRQMTNA